MRIRTLRPRSFVSAAIAVLACGSMAAAQDIIQKVTGKTSFQRFGAGMAALPDLNGDGVADLAVAYGSGDSTGTVDVLSGATAQLLFTIPAHGGAPTGTNRVALAHVGDVDADGVPDLAIGVPEASGHGSVQVVSGATGAPIHTLLGSGFERFGAAIAGLGDVDQDGRADFAVGAPGFTASPGMKPGRVVTFSGASATALWSFKGSLHDENAGAALARLADRDGDGIDDVAVGAPGVGFNFVSRGFVHVLSGATGALQHTISGEQNVLQLGFSVADAGDLDGDGVADLIVGVPNDIVDGAVRGSARAYSGSGAGVIRKFSTHDGVLGNQSQEGVRVRFAGDVDQDAVPDYLVIASIGGLGGGVVRLYSGATGGLLFSAWLKTTFGDVVDALALGDTNGDGRPDFAVSEPSNGPAPAMGTVYWMSPGKGSFSLLGEPCVLQQPAPRLRVEGSATAGGEVRVKMSHGGSNNVAWLFAGTAPAQLALPNGCSFLIANALPSPWVVSLGTDGYAEFSAKLPPGVSGSAVLQVVTLVPFWHFLISSSNAIEVQFQ